MIFEALMEAKAKGELLLVSGGFCRYHLRRDGQLTIHEILVTRSGEGIGSQMLSQLCQVTAARTILAKCPVDLESNRWYEKKGFVLNRKEVTPSGRELNIWVLSLK